MGARGGDIPVGSHVVGAVDVGGCPALQEVPWWGGDVWGGDVTPRGVPLHGISLL